MNGAHLKPEGPRIGQLQCRDPESPSSFVTVPACQSIFCFSINITSPGSQTTLLPLVHIMRQIIVTFLGFGLAGLAICSPMAKRAEPGDKLDHSFTVRLMSHHCAPFKASISLNTFDEHDDSSEVSAGGQTFTTLGDYQNADGTQVKPYPGFCQFGEIPFTKIPIEPRQFTVILVEEGHRQRKMDVSVSFHRGLAPQS